MDALCSIGAQDYALLANLLGMDKIPEYLFECLFVATFRVVAETSALVNYEGQFGMIAIH